MRDEIDVLTRRFLDGELTEDEMRDALRRMAEDPGARALLRFDLGLRSLLAESPARTTPHGFGDRVMRRIEALDAPAAADAREVASRADAADRWGRLATVWADLRRPRTLEWRPAHALLAVAAVFLIATAVFFLGAIGAGSGPWFALRGGPDSLAERPADEPSEGALRAILPPSADTVLVRFVLEAPDARSVAVAGDFSDWQPIPLVPHSRDGDPVWTGVVPLPRGEHRYMFVIDGMRWVTDPLAPAYWDDGFGNRNAILSL